MENKYDYDIAIAYQENIYSKLKTSKHILVDYLLKKNHKILYIEYPKPFNKWIIAQINRYRKKDKCSENFSKENLRIIRPLTILPTKFLFDKKFFAEIESFIVYIYCLFSLKKLKITSKTFLIYIPKAIRLTKDSMIKNNKKIYHLIDDFRYLPQSPECFKSYHEKTINECDIIITPSKVISRKLNLDKCKLIPHGFINYKTLGDTQEYTQFLNPKQNNIIYYGQFNKLDFTFAKKVIKELKGCNFIFIGKGDVPFKSKNLKVINSISHKKLINLLSKCQLLWCPFKVNRLTKSMTPIKFIESLSLGLPILSTQIDYEDTEIMHLIEFSNKSESHIRFIKNLKKSELYEDKLIRKKSVQDRNWNVIMNRYYELIF